MYEDSWYSFVPDFQNKRGAVQNGGHKRKESLLQQNDSKGTPDVSKPLPDLYEDEEISTSPPEPVLARRSQSYSDFYDIVRGKLRKDAAKKNLRKRNKDSQTEALSIDLTSYEESRGDLFIHGLFQHELLEASQQEDLLYHDQLALTERHLEALIQDTNGALELLGSLSKSFHAVEDQTNSFRSQCDDLLTEQKRLQTLADEVGTDLHYYAYLENVTRRLNAPGASRLVEDGAFAEVLANLDSCIEFMSKNPTYRDAESYLARYQALLNKALGLLEVVYTTRLEKVTAEVSKQIANTQSESARHALAYGRFQELIMESYSLIPNVQRVILSAYDLSGNARPGMNFVTYSNTANNMFQAYLATRDRDLRPITQSDMDTFKVEVKEVSVETAARNFIKQSFERSYGEVNLFAKIFSVEPQFSTDPNSVFAVLKPMQRSLVNGVNVAPIANTLQSALQGSALDTICGVIGWVTNEYLLMEYDDDETHFTRHCRELTARLLAEHLWNFTDAAFEAELGKSVSKAPIAPDSLKIGPVTNGIASSNAYPPVKRAVDLLILFDQSMPKERCQRGSPVVFKIVKETMAALQRAETRIKASQNGTDSDLFMIKNLLILKNALVSLEIGDVRSQESGLQQPGHIWDSLTAQGLMGLLSSIGSYMPALPVLPTPSSLWPLSRASTPQPGASARFQKTNSTSTTAGVATHPTLAGGDSGDASEQLDDLLRRSIYAFTQRWAALLNEARAAAAASRGKGQSPVIKVEKELETMLDRAFSNQPEVVAKLKEAIQLNAQAQNDAKRERPGSRATRS